MRSAWISAAVLFATLAVDSRAAVDELVIADQGASLAPIIVPKDATLYTRLAAEDLAEYLGRIGGTKVQVIEGAPEPVPEQAIWVGLQPRVKELFPGTGFDFKHPEEILLKASAQHLVIAGRDVWDPKAMSIKGGRTPAERQSYLAGFPFANRDVEGYQFEYGTVNAVYTFLQDKLGIRWLWPGASGEVVPKQTRIAIEPFEYRYHPKLRMRHGVFAPQAIYKQGGSSGTPSGDWVRRQRVQLDSLYVPASGHGFGDWLDRFGKTHSEYFALQSDGKRGWSGPAGAAKICESSEAVWQQWLADVDQCIAKNPHRRIFNCAPNDSTRHGHCTCEACRQWDSPDAERRIWMYQSSSSVIGTALSDRQVKLANTLGRLLEQRHPGKGYSVMIHAYGYSRPTPMREVPADNVYVALVHGFLFDRDAVDVDSPRKTKHIDEFKGWMDKTKNAIWRPNLGDSARWQSGGPGDATGSGEVFKMVIDQGVQGILIDLVGSWWATQGPQYYLMAQMAWNPNRRVADVLDDYYRSGFGAAAGEIKDYWDLMAIARRNVANDHQDWLEVFTPALFQCAEKVLDKAAANSKVTAEQRTRVAFVRAGLDYLRLNTANQLLVKEVLASKTPAAAAKERMAVNWAAIEQLAKQHPEAFPMSQIQNPKNELSYIHPDTDHQAEEAQRLRKERIAERLRKNALAETPNLQKQ